MKQWWYGYSVTLNYTCASLPMLLVILPIMEVINTEADGVFCWMNYSVSKISHHRCVYINSRCRYQSITQQYLKRCLIKDDSNYMFRPIATIIRFSSESMVVVLYRIGMCMSRWWDLSICDVCYMLLLRGRNMSLLSSFTKRLFRCCCVIDWYLHLLLIIVSRHQTTQNLWTS